MHLVGFAERHGLTRQPHQSLPQRVVEALDVAGLTVAFASCDDVLLRRQHDSVGFPEVGVDQALLLNIKNTLPELATSRLGAVSDCIRHDLASAAAQGEPHPAFVFAPCDKRPELIAFQAVARLGRSKRGAEFSQLADFFEPGGKCVAADAEDAAHAPHRGALAGRRRALESGTLQSECGRQGWRSCLPERLQPWQK